MSDPDRASAVFSLDLSDDVVQMRDWLHEFAASVIRPAAAEWDECEEMPWPVLEEAAKVGLYSLDFYAQQYLEGSGLGIPVAFEELFWGDAGIGLALAGSSLAAVAVVANGTPEQVGEWCPQMFGGPGDVKLGAFCSSEPEAGSDVGAIRTAASPMCTWLSRRWTRRWDRAGRRASSCRRARPGCPWGRSSVSTGSGPRTPPRSCWPMSGCPDAAWWAAGNGWRSGWRESGRAAAAASRPR